MSAAIGMLRSRQVMRLERASSLVVFERVDRVWLGLRNPAVGSSSHGVTVCVDQSKEAFVGHCG